MPKSSLEKEIGLARERAWHSPLLLAVLRLTAVIGTVWMGAIFTTTPILLRTPFGLFEIGLILALWTTCIARFSDAARFATISIVYFGTSAAAILYYGTPPGLPVLLGLFVLVATFYYDWKGGCAAAAASLLLVAAGGWGWTTGVLPVDPSIPRLQATSLELWMRTIFAQIMGFGGIICIVSYVLREMRAVVSRLRLAEEKFSRAFRVSPDAMVITELETGRFLEVNDGHMQLTGFSREESVGRTSVDIGTFRSVADREKFAGPLRESGSIRNTEFQIMDRAGRTIDAVCSAECFDLNGMRYAVATLRDVGERKRAEQALRESEERFRNLTAASFEGIVITEGGRILDINDQGLKMLGYERSEMVGRDAVDFVSPESRQAVGDAIRAQRELEYEHQMVRKDGTQIQVEARAKVAHTGGRLVRMTALRDVSERHEAEKRRKTLEEQLRQTHKMEALGTLAGGIAHDFNNILTVITCNIELLRIKLPGNEVGEHLDAVAQASVRAASLVRQILTFSREEVTQRKAIILAPVVAEAMRFLRSTIPSTIEIGTDLAADATVVLADATQIHQVIMNLGTNAWHSMKDRQGRIDVRLETVDVDLDLAARVPDLRVGRCARLTFSDSGMGMDRATLGRIFEPFFTTKPVGEGTGLGLSVVHGIMQSHEGAVAVSSEPGEGTTFQLYFPARASEVSAVEIRKPSAPAGNGECILLVDDEPSIASLGRSILQGLNYKVEAHTNALEALESFRVAPQRFDLVILDQTMPVMTGIDLAGRIGTVRPDLPIILTTGYAGQMKIEQLRAKGICELLLKPSTIQSLGGIVHRVLSERART